MNLDQPVKLNGQTVPLGRQLAAGPPRREERQLHLGPHRQEGCRQGTRRRRVRLRRHHPGELLEGGDLDRRARPPTRRRPPSTSRTSQKSKLVDPAISQAVTTTATSVLNKQLTSTYIENVYVGFNTLDEQLGKAADGADQLASGLDAAGERDPPARRRRSAALRRRVVAGGRHLAAVGRHVRAGGRPAAALGERTGAEPGRRQQLAGSAASASARAHARHRRRSTQRQRRTAHRRIVDPKLGALCQTLSDQLVNLNTAQAYSAGVASGAQTFARPARAVHGRSRAVGVRSGAARLRRVAVRGRRSAVRDRRAAAERRHPRARLRCRPVGLRRRVPRHRPAHGRQAAAELRQRRADQPREGRRPSPSRRSPPAPPPSAAPASRCSPPSRCGWVRWRPSSCCRRCRAARC